MAKELTMTRHQHIRCLFNLDNVPWDTNSIINNRFETAFAILVMFSGHSKRSLWIPVARSDALTLRLAWGQFETICEITPWILPWWGGGGRPNYILITHPTSLQFASVKISYRSQTIFQSHNPRGNFVMIRNIVLPITQITIVAYFSNTKIIVSILLSKIPPPWYSCKASQRGGEIWRIIHILLEQNNSWCSAKRKKSLTTLLVILDSSAQPPQTMNFLQRWKTAKSI